MATECDRAKDSNGREISIAMASSGANGYFCLGCGRELVAHIGKVYEPHFKHHPRYSIKQDHCTYSSETHRHKLAKEIIQRLRRVKVPAVYQFAPAGWKRYQLQPAQFIEAQDIKIERNIYEDAQGRLGWERSNDAPFDDEGSTRELLVRPDVMFLNANGKAILLIEFCATHAVDEKKLMKLRRLGVDTIEIYIPKTFTPEDIEGLFSSTTNTAWLYNHEQFTTPIASTQPAPGAGSELLIGNEGRLSEQPESLKCRKLWLGAALRGIRKALESTDFATATEEHIRFAAGLSAQLRERNKRADGVVRERVAQAEAQQAAEDAIIQQKEGTLDREVRYKEAQLERVTQYLQDRISRAKAEWSRDNRATEDELHAAEVQLSIERQDRESERRSLDREEARLGKEEEYLRGEEAGLDRKESTLRQQEEEELRNLSRSESELNGVKEEERLIALRKDQLRKIKEKPNRG